MQWIDEIHHNHQVAVIDQIHRQNFLFITATGNPKFHFTSNVSFCKLIMRSLRCEHFHTARSPQRHLNTDIVTITSLCTFNNFPFECGSEFNDFVQTTWIRTSIHEVMEHILCCGHSLSIPNVNFISSTPWWIRWTNTFPSTTRPYFHFANSVNCSPKTTFIRSHAMALTNDSVSLLLLWLVAHDGQRDLWNNKYT